MGQTDQCITMAEFEELALAVARGEGDEEELKRYQQHLLSGCAVCRSNWSVGNLLRQLPAGVVRTHLETLDQQIRNNEAN